MTIKLQKATYKFLLIMLSCSIIFSGCNKDSDEPEPTPEIMFPQEVTVTFENLIPEGIEYNKNDTAFLLGSLTMGDVFKVDFEGNYTNFTNDENLQSSAGIHIDYAGDRLLVTSLDPGAFGGSKSIAALNVYKLSNGEKINEVSLLTLLPDADFFTPNDITVDDSGNVYITDFIGEVIYKVNQNYEASVFSASEALVGPNGIDFHPDGYLLISNLRANELIKMPIEKPEDLNVVIIDDPLFGGMDGIVYKADGKLVGITNLAPETLIELSSTDDWQSATVENSKALSSFGTTVAVTPEGHNYALLTDILNQAVFTDWVIEKIEF